MIIIIMLVIIMIVTSALESWVGPYILDNDASASSCLPRDTFDQKTLN